VYSDPRYEDGYYTFEEPPTAGLGAARMSALLTYRSRDSFEARFGRNTPDLSNKPSINQGNGSPDHNEHWSIHNDGHIRAKGSRESRPASRNGTISDPHSQPDSPASQPQQTYTDPQFHGTTEFTVPVPVLSRRTSQATRHYFSAQSYLRYQGNKFVTRFDANCYIAITRKLDTHDVSRNRAASVKEALSQIQQPALVLGIESDGLFTFAEQQEIAEGIPKGRLGRIDSPEGHDAFLLQFEQVNNYLLEFFREVLPDIMDKPGIDGELGDETVKDGVGKMTKSSTFGEAEVEDLTAW
jgi:homoserine O-acetyltransferase